jgi:hypothetical protein
MNIILLLKEFNIMNVFFLERIKNTIMDNSHFIRLNYSNSLLSWNGIYLLVEFNAVKHEAHYNKYKYTMDINNNQQVISTLNNIEQSILSKYKANKQKKLVLCDYLSSGFIKMSNKCLQYNNKFILKISGIWENPKEYGLTFKFIENTNHQL